LKPDNGGHPSPGRVLAAVPHLRIRSFFIIKPGKPGNLPVRYDYYFDDHATFQSLEDLIIDLRKIDAFLCKKSPSKSRFV
jgi:hypothetical protein